MDYHKIYNQLIENAKQLKEERIRLRKSGEYFETHHIIPVCLGGQGLLSDWNHENLVQLTAREHFICHRLLTKMYLKNKKLAGAFWRMCSQKSNIQQRYIPSSREYEEARLHWRSIPVSQETRDKLSKINKGKKKSPETIEKLRKARLGTKQSPETIRKKSEKQKGQIPWNKGIKYSEEQCKKMSKKDTLLGKKREAFSDETKKKMSKAKKGITPWNKGIERPKKICPHCDKEGGDGNMQRWHFENCKFKKN